MDKQLVVGLKELPEIKPVENESFVKPRYGLWTSTYRPHNKYASAWVEWCVTEMPKWIKNKPAILLEVKDYIKVFEIDTQHQLQELYALFPSKLGFKTYSLKFIDWERVAKYYDGVHLTEAGQWRTRYSKPINLNGWDCESTLWFRDVFKSWKRYKGKLIRC